MVALIVHGYFQMQFCFQYCYCNAMLICTIIQGSSTDFSNIAGSGKHGGSCRDAAAVSEPAGRPPADTQRTGNPEEIQTKASSSPFRTSCTQVAKQKRAATLNLHAQRWYAICNMIPPNSCTAQFSNNQSEPNIGMHVLYSVTALSLIYSAC